MYSRNNSRPRFSAFSKVVVHTIANNLVEDINLQSVILFGIQVVIYGKLLKNSFFFIFFYTYFLQFFILFKVSAFLYRKVIELLEKPTFDRSPGDS